MAKIKSVRVWGFQSWVAAKYDLVAGLNVFTGPSGAGKTAGTIRALRWLAKGEPSGDDFLHTVYEADGVTIKRQAEEAGVEVELDNGVTITKIRKKGKTKYWVKPLYDEPFEKAEVPAAVKEALGIKTSSFGDYEVDLHFAFQLAAPFLISEPGSAGAKVLGKLAGTEAVDGAIKSTAKDTYAARNEKQTADKEYERKVEQLKAFEGLDEIKRQLDACEWLMGELDKALNKKGNLEQLTTAWELTAASIQQAINKLDKLANIPELEEDLVEIEKAQQRYDRLLDLYEQLGKATATVEILTQRLKDLAGLDACEWLLSEAETAESRRASLSYLNEQYNKYEADVNRATEIITSTQDLDVALNTLESVELSFGRITDMRQLLRVYDTATASVSRYQGLMDSLIGITEAENLVSSTEANLVRLAKLRELYNLYKIKTQTLDSAAAAETRAANELAAADKELAEAWAATGGICPLCEQAVAHTH
ncbi:ATP-binding protein [Paenibacillus sinopodophylli]|uniref:ATP-binding protein n=1 Tax=Paenibacillus sinopodophylli TaxID=1837342 RepID=UPI00110D0E94|nr:ATP-binding protein [Paenibacillus sinopodophylli]